MFFENIAFIGGDKRQLFAAWEMAERGFKVYLAGFDKLISFGPLNIAGTEEALSLGDIAVLPVTGLRDGNVPTYFSDKEIKLDENTIELIGDKPVFLGKSETLGGFKSKLRYHDLLKRGDFAVLNALPTAEGAVQTAMESFEGVISGSRILVIGYGRIGKILSRTLRALNAEVTVASRKSESRACITADGSNPANTEKIGSLSGYDIVFNTADALVIDRKILLNTKGSPLIIDLASPPCGVDFSSAEELGFSAVKASGLPGKCSPKTAGRIISDTVLNILEEEYNWQKRI